ncbi:HeH/LEM domain-containing protein [Clostridium sp.]|uniref:HeH/LEM domain-containing protein n=1 Tax=Clostridium sp. TaxID=1506 RepID=UPI00290FE6A5|nr:HeH/LEM domain-containing protein [Clostridium sp.]MDU4726389.1 HeH/LEM domain-containing protein [Clostridium sp.]
MSATAFQRRRRELKAKKEQLENSNSLEQMTVKDIKTALDEKGIEYDPKTKKEELIKLLKGAE